MTRRFAASVRNFERLTKEALRDVYREAVQSVVEDAQTPVAEGGRMPVDTGFLRNSVASGLNGDLGATGPAAVSLVLAGMELTDAASVAWTAEYAWRVENGFNGADALGRVYNQEGRHFLGVAAARWPQYVAAAAERHKV